jgi:hypothetical protein
MDTQKLKIKIGDHEFEAEGPAEVVQAQFAAWRDLIATLGHKPAPPPPTPPTPEPAAQGNSIGLDRITKVEGRVVSLTARAANIEEEILLVLVGQKILRNNESVTGAEIMDGLKRTGHVVRRIDYKLDKMSEGAAASVITIGTGRERRYRLTNSGFAKAQALAMDLAQRVA